eukprot:6259246-Lingulodinium_polyedra.AAC.1
MDGPRQLVEQQRRVGKAADALERCISSLGSRVQQRLAATEQDELDVERSTGASTPTARPATGRGNPGA